MNNNLTISVQLDLIKARIEILKLKADDCNWQSYVPKDVKEQLEETLVFINSQLKTEM